MLSCKGGEFIFKVIKFTIAGARFRSDTGGVALES